MWASFLVIAGVMLAMRRRMRSRDALVLQRFGEDFLPLILLFAVSVTGLMLVVSYEWMNGYAYEFLSITHAVTVIGTLLWLPFGKFFHLFQRPAQLGVLFYKDAGARGEQAQCASCHEPFASRMHVEDLIEVERQLGYRYEMTDGPTDHYQRICPRCRRRVVGAWRRGSSGMRHAAHRNLTDTTAWLKPPTSTTRHYSAVRSASWRYAAGTRLDRGVEPDRLVKTHCCFCGQQCGIQLKVKDNEVIGFEPWEEFPFNRGMLCPKGVKRYLQGSHPDRLDSARMQRDPTASGGFRALDYEDGNSPARPRPSDAFNRNTAMVPSPCSAAPA